jgi:hypothetical protein
VTISSICDLQNIYHYQDSAPFNGWERDDTDTVKRKKLKSSVSSERMVPIVYTYCMAIPRKQLTVPILVGKQMHKDYMSSNHKPDTTYNLKIKNPKCSSLYL